MATHPFKANNCFNSKGIRNRLLLRDEHSPTFIMFYYKLKLIFNLNKSISSTNFRAVCRMKQGAELNEF